MKILVNTSTLVGSGVTQVAVSFLYECLKLDNKNEYHVFLGQKVSESIRKDDFDKRFYFYDFPIKPLSIFKGGLRSVSQMKKREEVIKPDVVFTVFGPSWWTPKKPHLQGYANPYYIFKSGPYFKIISFKERLKLLCMESVHKFFLKRNGKYYVSETEYVSREFAKLLKKADSPNFFTVSNTCNSFFRNFNNDSNISFLPKKKVNEFRFISLCTPQKHKNLEILNQVIPLLRSRGYENIKFVLTIDKEELVNFFFKESMDAIVGVGRIQVAECPYLFNECDALFLPTLAECFTANYPEAMKLEKAICTSDLPFSRDICLESALYFNPMDPNDICDKLIYLVENKYFRDDLIKKGIERLKYFDTPESRAVKYLDILNLMLKNNDYNRNI